MSDPITPFWKTFLTGYADGWVLAADEVVEAVAAQTLGLVTLDDGGQRGTGEILCRPTALGLLVGRNAK